MVQENPFVVPQEQRMSPPPQSAFELSFATAKQEAINMSHTALLAWRKQSVWGKIGIALVLIVTHLMGIAMLIFHEPILDTIVEYSDRWAHISWMPWALGATLFVISFPPLIGFSLTNTIIGCLFGITFHGWFIIAAGSISGSVAAFLVFRYFFHSKAQALISSNKKLYAFSSVLRDNNSFWIIALIRVCPFPYSLTNGALAAIPGLTVMNFTLGSVISSPKLTMYLFVGEKIKDIGRTKDPMSRFIDIISILFTVLALTFTGWLLFTRTSQRLQELEREGALPRPEENEDFESRLVNGEEDSLDDALSLHTQDGTRHYTD